MSESRANSSLPLTGVVLVTTPQDLAAKVVWKDVHVVQQMGVPIIGVVENMSYFICPDTGRLHELFGQGATDELLWMTGAPLLARLPLSPAVARLCDEGRIEELSADATVGLGKTFTGILSMAPEAAGVVGQRA